MKQHKPREIQTHRPLGSGAVSSDNTDVETFARVTSLPYEH